MVWLSKGGHRAVSPLFHARVELKKVVKASPWLTLLKPRWLSGPYFRKLFVAGDYLRCPKFPRLDFAKI